jgi:hypothetical protein
MKRAAAFGGKAEMSGNTAPGQPQVGEAAKQGELSFNIEFASAGGRLVEFDSRCKLLKLESPLCKYIAGLRDHLDKEVKAPHEPDLPPHIQLISSKRNANNTDLLCSRATVLEGLALDVDGDKFVKRLRGGGESLVMLVDLDLFEDTDVDPFPDFVQIVVRAYPNTSKGAADAALRAAAAFTKQYRP